MAIGTEAKRIRSLIAFDQMLPIPDGDINNITDRASGVQIYYVTGECDELEFLLSAGFTATVSTPSHIRRLASVLVMARIFGSSALAGSSNAAASSFMGKIRFWPSPARESPSCP